MLEREDQFLDLIAENAQMKEEIKSIQEYSAVVQLLDREFLMLCREQTLDEEVDLTSLDQKIVYLRNGMRPVNSAEAWKSKLKHEILSKQNQSSRSVCDSLLERRSKSSSKLDALEKDISVLNQKINESRTKCQRATKERDRLKQQIEECQQFLDKSSKTLQDTKSAVEAEQAASIKIKKTMEQTAKSLYTYSQTNAGASQPSVAESIKEIQTYLDSSA